MVLGAEVVRVEVSVYVARGEFPPETIMDPIWDKTNTDDIAKAMGDYLLTLLKDKKLGIKLEVISVIA